MKDPVPKAPALDSLPKAVNRNRRHGPPMTEIKLDLEVITPILGGSAVLKSVDEIDFIRPAIVRGHLRFWWRALNVQMYAESDKLFERESLIFGKAADRRGGRSQVEIRISGVQAGKKDTGKVDLASPAGYALWPARVKDGDDIPRMQPGTRFKLDVHVPSDLEGEIRDVIRAWILFGGYGSRVRRGLGSISIQQGSNSAGWLPDSVSREEFTRLFVRDVFAAGGGSSTETPRLDGASLHAGSISSDCIESWRKALDWLRMFRQGTTPYTGKGQARNRGSSRPSLSNWPEPDKVRHLSGKRCSHTPRHNEIPVWPRAGFGLPIVGKFQTKATDGSTFLEPGPYEINWKNGLQIHERLASPLILKALPLTGGRYVPCALWLAREMPADAQACLLEKNSAGEKVEVVGSAARFSALKADGDPVLFPALDGFTDLKSAFFDWLRATQHTSVVVP